MFPHFNCPNIQFEFYSVAASLENLSFVYFLLSHLISLLFSHSLCSMLQLVSRILTLLLYQGPQNKYRSRSYRNFDKEAILYMRKNISHKGERKQYHIVLQTRSIIHKIIASQQNSGHKFMQKHLTYTYNHFYNK